MASNALGSSNGSTAKTSPAKENPSLKKSSPLRDITNQQIDHKSQKEATPVQPLLKSARKLTFDSCHTSSSTNATAAQPAATAVTASMVQSGASAAISKLSSSLTIPLINPVTAQVVQSKKGKLITEDKMAEMKKHTAREISKIYHKNPQYWHIVMQCYTQNNPADLIRLSSIGTVPNAECQALVVHLLAYLYE